MIKLILALPIVAGICLSIVAIGCVIWGKTEYKYYDLERPDLIKLEELR
ncbi:TPA: hypothetical protein LA747_003486 [Clostridium botulinum]|nr:hypothetical protein [Clostridium botulinum]HBJ2607823.1 hypothetical protein [Clostridium botulinum]HDI3019176.1 hypothetical protein [Clostridium botulinum]